MGEDLCEVGMKSGGTDPAPDLHRYTLWRGQAGRQGEASAPAALVISMGEHGSMLVTPADDPANHEPDSPARMSQTDLAGHNVAEARRAIEEGRKWEMRLNRSPLGKTQQDYVAYYTEVIALFKEWCASNGVALPP
jgi:hypothetical protein